MTIDTTGLDTCECGHPRYQHRWYFWPEPEVSGQCWHGAHAVDGEGNCGCASFELAETHGTMPKFAKLNPTASHVHRYDQGHAKCNLHPPCTDPIPQTVVEDAKAAYFSPEEIVAWPEMQALQHLMGVTLTEGRETLAAECGATLNARVDAHLCWCGHERREHGVFPMNLSVGSCRHGKYTAGSCPCGSYELADTAPDLIENCLALIDSIDQEAPVSSFLTGDDHDLIRRARRWLDTQEARNG